MKKKISRILGVVLSLALLSTLAMAAAPVSAAVGVNQEINAWDNVGLPAVAPDTDVEVIAVAPDGTLFASVYDDTYWTLWKSSDGGFKWTKTAFKDYDYPITSIACAPIWYTGI